MKATNTTTETALEEAQAPVHPANRTEEEKNRRAYWAAYRRGRIAAPVLLFPNRMDALVRGYKDGLAQREKDKQARDEGQDEALAELTATAGN